jgi:hypothetical protein
MVDRTPTVMGLSIDFHENLVQMPLPIGMGVLPLDTFLADLGCENRAEPIPPKPHRLVTDIDPSLVQQVYNISKGSGNRTYIITARRMISGLL